ncbi:hypothetical protein ACLOJK_033606 [Asimina triloba]
MPDSEPRGTQWENATAGAIAGFATVATLHPLDVVRTRFQGILTQVKIVYLGAYLHNIMIRCAMQGLRGLYAGFFPAVIGSTVSWGLYFFFYNKAKQKYSKGSEKQLSPSLHLLSAAEAGALLQVSVSHGAIQFTAYEEFRKIFIHFKCNQGRICKDDEDKLLNSVDYALLGASSKIAAILLTYPYQVIRARLQQRPSTDGVPKYVDSWHVVKETVSSSRYKTTLKNDILAWKPAGSPAVDTRLRAFEDFTEITPYTVGGSADSGGVGRGTVGVDR